MLAQRSVPRRIWWWPFSNWWRALRLVGEQISSGYPPSVRAAYLRLRAHGAGTLRARLLLVRPYLESEDSSAVHEYAARRLYQSRLEDAVARYLRRQ